MTRDRDGQHDVEAGTSAGEPQRGPLRSEHVRSVREGHGANCSSIGSVVDTLFATATIGAAVFAAVVAALSKEPVRMAPRDEPRRSSEP